MICRACGGRASFAFVKDGDPCSRCPDCGSLSRTVPFDPGERYESYLPPATLSLPAGTRERYREMLRRIDGFGEPARRRLLDVGAGAGLFLTVAREAGWEAEGVELSRAAGEAAAARGETVHVGDLDVLGLDPFDAAVALETVEHVPDPFSFLRAVARCVRPGGALLLTTPNYAALSRRLLGREWLAVSRDHLCLFTPRALAGVVGRAGFVVKSVGTRTILPNEIVKRFRPGPARRQGFRARETASLQESFTARPGLRRLKGAANRFLRATGLGDVITLLAVREQPG